MWFVIPRPISLRKKASQGRWCPFSFGESAQAKDFRELSNGMTEISLDRTIRNTIYVAWKLDDFRFLPSRGQRVFNLRSQSSLIKRECLPLWLLQNLLANCDADATDETLPAMSARDGKYDATRWITLIKYRRWNRRLIYRVRQPSISLNVPYEFRNQIKDPWWAPRETRSRRE